MTSAAAARIQAATAKAGSGGVDKGSFAARAQSAAAHHANAASAGGGHTTTGSAGGGHHGASGHASGSGHCGGGKGK